MRILTMTELKNTLGAVRHEVTRHGESFLLLFQGKPFAKLVPESDDTVILPDGSIRGPKPLTFREDLGGEYA